MIRSFLPSCVLALVACNRGDPALDRYGKALRAWEDAQLATQRGDAATAVVAMAEARMADPDSVPLALAEAKALADAGRTGEAISALGVVLRANSAVGEAWYNRAAYRARTGEMDAAASDLKEALRLGVRTQLEAASDPDFASALAHPAFVTLLPPQPILADASGPPGAVFVGGDVDIRLRIVALPGARLTVQRKGVAPSCLRLSAIVQNDGADGVRELTLRFVGAEACVGTIGPFVVSSGVASVTTNDVIIEVGAAPDFVGQNVGMMPIDFPVPAMFAEEGWNVGRVQNVVVAMGRADQPVKGNGRKPDATLAWRVGGDTRAAGGLWIDDGAMTVTAEGWSGSVLPVDESGP